MESRALAAAFADAVALVEHVPVFLALVGATERFGDAAEGFPSWAVGMAPIAVDFAMPLMGVELIVATFTLGGFAWLTGRVVVEAGREVGFAEGVFFAAPLRLVLLAVAVAVVGAVVPTLAAVAVDLAPEDFAAAALAEAGVFELPATVVVLAIAGVGAASEVLAGADAATDLGVVEALAVVREGGDANLAEAVVFGSAVVGLTLVRGALAEALGEVSFAELPGGEPAVAFAELLVLAEAPLALGF